jgi:hypothetical protein
MTTVEKAPRSRGTTSATASSTVSAGFDAIAAAISSESLVLVNVTPAARRPAWSSTALMRLPLWASASSRVFPPAPAERWTGWEFSHALEPVVE